MSYEIKRDESAGFFYVSPQPSERELEQYYSEKYYQNSLGHYEISYSDQELEFFANEAKCALATLSKYDRAPRTMLDVGCGEGFFAKHMSLAGMDVELVDFSVEGLQTQNPEMIKFFHQEDVNTFLDDAAVKGNRYDLVNLDNVLEHVINPRELLTKLRSIMTTGSTLRVEVPNDFSNFQDLLLKENLTQETWINPPEHLSYFNVESINRLFSELKYDVFSLQAGYPIEQFLLNSHSNYVNDAKLGRSAHKARVATVNYLASQSVASYVDYSEAAAKMDFGRTLTIYAQTRPL